MPSAANHHNNSNAGKICGGFGMGTVNAKLVKNENIRIAASNREKQREVQSQPEIGRQKKGNSQIRYNNRLIREKLVQ